MIPLVLKLRIGSAHRRGFGLWLPLFPILLLLFGFFVLLLPLMAIAEILLTVAGRYIPLIGMFWFVLSLMTKMSGTEIHVNGSVDKESIDISIY